MVMTKQPALFDGCSQDLQCDLVVVCREMRDEVMDRPVELLGMGEKLTNVLLASGIKTIKDLGALVEIDWPPQRINRVGKKRAREIDRAMRNYLVPQIGDSNDTQHTNTHVRESQQGHPKPENRLGNIPHRIDLQPGRRPALEGGDQIHQQQRRQRGPRRRGYDTVAGSDRTAAVGTKQIPDTVECFLEIGAAYTLTDVEGEVAELIGTRKYEYSQGKNATERKFGGRTGLETQIIGFAAEMAFGRLANLYPDLSAEPRGYDFITHAGCTIDVKQGKRHYYDLLVPEYKLRNLCDCYVLMTGVLPTFIYQGWATAKELSQDVSPVRRPGFRNRSFEIMRSDLRDLMPFNPGGPHAKEIQRLVEHQDAGKDKGQPPRPSWL
jgi:hypothetical protein